MKILLISGVFPPRKYGGVTAISYITAKVLSERGHVVTVYTTDVGNNQHSRLKVSKVKFLNGIEVHYFRNVSNFIAFKHRILSPLGMLPELIRNIRKYDVVHLNGFRNLQDVIVAFMAKKYGVPYVLQTHGSLPRIMTKKRLKYIYDLVFGYKIINAAARIIALNKFEERQYESMGITKEKIVINPNGIDLSCYSILPMKGLFKKRYSIPVDKKIILYLSRIDKIKGVDHLIRAYAHLVKDINYKDVILIIAGPDEGFLNEVKLLSESLGISNMMLFIGALHGKEKLEAYVDSDVYVLSSRYETFPMGLLEAYACGKPVVVSKVGGLIDLVLEGRTGFIVDPEQTVYFANKLHYLLNDLDTAVKMGAAGQLYVRNNFDISKVMYRLEKIYARIINE